MRVTHPFKAEMHLLKCPGALFKVRSIGAGPQYDIRPVMCNDCARMVSDLAAYGMSPPAEVTSEGHYTCSGFVCGVVHMVRVGAVENISNPADVGWDETQA
jgi:hypothetical protein